MARHEIGPEHGHDTEKQEHIEVSEPPVAVRVPAQGVFHCAHDGGGAEEQHQDRGHVPQGAERRQGHRRAGNDAQAHEQADEPLHLADGENAPVEPVLRALAVRRVRPVQDVAQFVGKVGQDLEADGREDDQEGYPKIHAEIGRGEEDAQQDAACGQRQGTEPHRSDGGTELIHT